MCIYGYTPQASPFYILGHEGRRQGEGPYVGITCHMLHSRIASMPLHIPIANKVQYLLYIYQVSHPTTILYIMLCQYQRVHSIWI